MVCVSVVAVSVTVSCEQTRYILIGVAHGVGDGIVGKEMVDYMCSYSEDNVAIEPANYKTAAEYLQAQNAKTKKHIENSQIELLEIDSADLSAEDKKAALKETIEKLDAARKDTEAAMSYAKTADQKCELKKTIKELQKQSTQVKERFKVECSKVNKQGR